MRKNSKSVLCILLSVMICMTALVGCKDSGTVSGDKTSSTDKTQSVAPTDKPQKIVFAAPIMGPVDNNSEAQQYLNTLIPNLEIELLPLELSTYTDQLNPRLASGDVPDIFKLLGRTFYGTYQKQGVLQEVTPAQIKENMPKFVEATKDYGYECWSVPTVDGKIYGVPEISVANTRPFTNCWRKDWLDKVGITKIPETLEEYGAAFEKFVKEDPDGNGKNDTYGFTFRGKDAKGNWATSIFGAFGIFPNMFNVQEDGSVKYGISDPRAKDALTVLNDWFKKGYIDPEFVTVDNTISMSKWSNSKVGMGIDTTYYEILPGAARYENLVAITPTAVIVPGNAPQGPDGTFGYMNWGKLSNGIAFGSSISKEPGKLEKTLQLLDVVCTNMDVYTKCKFGTEGLTWNKAEDGATVLIAPYNDTKNNGPLGTNFFYSSFPLIPAIQDGLMGRELEKQYATAIAGNVKNGEDFLSFLGGYLPTEATTDYQAAAENIMLENFINFITGARSLDEYDKFVVEWNKAGGEKYNEIATATAKSVQDQFDTAIKAFE